MSLLKFDVTLHSYNTMIPESFLPEYERQILKFIIKHSNFRMKIMYDEDEKDNIPNYKKVYGTEKFKRFIVKLWFNSQNNIQGIKQTELTLLCNQEINNIFNYYIKLTDKCFN